MLGYPASFAFGKRHRLTGHVTGTIFSGVFEKHGMTWTSSTLNIGGVTIPGRVFLAPLAAYTSWPFRRICRRLGAALVATEVIKARELVKRIPATLDYIGFKPDEHPIAGQFMSCDPGEAGEAAAIMSELGFDLIDLNMGCPKRRVVSDGMGGALMESPEQGATVVRAMCRQATVPVTVKMRAGRRRGEVTAIEMAQRCEAAGAAAICLHPRFAEGASSLCPDWNLIGEVKRAVSIPVVGNGGIRTPADAKRMFEETGCDAVMIGEGSFGRPWIFREITALMENGAEASPPSQSEILAILLEHYDGLIQHHGEKRGTIMMRKQSCHYAKHLVNGKAFNQAVIRLSTREAFMSAVDYWLKPTISRQTKR